MLGLSALFDEIMHGQIQEIGIESRVCLKNGVAMSRIKRSVACVAASSVVVLSAGLAYAAPLPPAQWKKQANAICTQMQAEINQAGDAANATLSEGEQPSAELLAAFDAQFVAAVERAVAAIDSLKEPKALKSDVKAFTKITATELAVVKSNPSLLGQNVSPMPKATKAAKKLGLTNCAEG